MTAQHGSRRLRETPATEQVLGAALALFTKQGYFNTSIPDIVKASSVSTGSIYHYFRDKEGIARQLYETLLERMETAFAEIETTHETTHDRCRAVVELLFLMIEEEP